MEAEDGAVLPPAAEELDFRAALAEALLALEDEEQDGMEAEEILDFQALMEEAMLARDEEELEEEAGAGGPGQAGEQLPAEQHADDDEDLVEEELGFGPGFDLDGMAVFGQGGGGDDNRDDPFFHAFVRFVVLLAAAIIPLLFFLLQGGEPTLPPLPPT